MYRIEMQFIPNNSQIWVLKLNPEDPIYEYDNEVEARAKAEELQASDKSGRLYRVSSVTSN